jgi:hypothetical protein
MRVKRWVSLCIFPLIEKWMAAGEKRKSEAGKILQNVLEPRDWLALCKPVGFSMIIHTTYLLFNCTYCRYIIHMEKN